MSNVSARPDVKLEKGARIKVIRRMCSYLFQYKWMVLLAFVLMITSNLLALVAPRLSGLAIDAIEPGKGAVVFEEVFFFCGLMLIFYALSAILSYSLSVLMINLSQRIIYTMRRAKNEANPIEKRRHLYIGMFPLMVIAGGLLQVLFLPDLTA